MSLAFGAAAQLQFSFGAMPYYYNANISLSERGYHNMGDYTSSAGFSAAAFAQLHLGGFAIRLEGSKLNYEFSSDRVNIPPVFEPEKYASVNFQYSMVEIPLIGIYEFGVGKFQPYIGGGVTFGFVGSTEFSETVFNFEDFRGDVDYDAIAYRWNDNSNGFLLLGGLGIKFNSNIRAKVGGRYVINETKVGVAKINNPNSRAYGIGSTKLFTKRIQFELGLEYRL